MLVLVFANFMEVNYQLALNSRCATQVQKLEHVPNAISFVVFTYQLCGRYHCTTNPCQVDYNSLHLNGNWTKTPPLPFTPSNQSAGIPIHSQNFSAETNLTGFRCLMESVQCLDVGYSPNNGLYSFDDIFSAMFSTFQIITLKQWESGMFYLQDSVSSNCWIVYLVIIVVCGLMLVNLYPSIISVKMERAFEVQKERKWAESGSEFKSSDRNKIRSKFQEVLFMFKHWEKKDQEVIEKIEQAKRGHLRGEEVEEEKLPYLTPVFEGSTQWREFVRAETGPFALVIYGCIIINIMMLALQKGKADHSIMGTTLYVFNRFFEMVFFLEAIFKLMLFGPVGYFGHKSNLFDFFVSMLGFIDVCTPPSINLSQFSGLRILRLFRLVKLVKAVKLQKALTSHTRPESSQSMDFSRLLYVISNSTSWLMYTYLLLAVFLFIFSVLGMQFFGSRLEDDQTFGTALREDGLKKITIPLQEEYYGFSCFGRAMISIFIIFTGDHWTSVAFNAVEGFSPTLLFFFCCVDCGLKVFYHVYGHFNYFQCS